MDEIDDRGLNGDQFSKSMSNIDVRGGSSNQKTGALSSKSLGGSSTGNRAFWMQMNTFGYILLVCD